MTSTSPHLLLVYQNADARRRLMDLLDSLDLRVTEVSSGLEAIEILHTAIVDLVVTDINIGSFDCWRLARIIRSGIYRCDKMVPIIVVTQIWCERITEVTARDFGVTALLPYEQRKRLPEIVTAALENDLVAPQLPRVLVVEDHPDNARLVQKILQERFAVDLALDGVEGLAAWRKGRHDLVLLDVMLPGLSGSDVLDAVLREDPSQVVVIMTAHGTMDIAEQLMTRGAVDFISKPFRPDQLRRVCELAARREDHLVTHQQFADRLASLQKLRDLLSSIVNSMPSVLIGVDQSGRITQWNQGATGLIGVPASVAHGKPLLDIWPKDFDLSELYQALLDRQVRQKNKVTWIKKKQTAYYDLTIYPLLSGQSGAVIRIDDVTKRVEMEKQVLQAEKMSSLGQLAAGIANEINNPLAGVLQNLQVVSHRLNPNLEKNRQVAQECDLDFDALACYLENRGIPNQINAIRESGLQASRLVEGMLGFSHSGTQLAKVPSRLDDLLEKAIILATSKFSLERKFDFRSIQIKREIQDVPAVSCDPGQIQQVFLQLLLTSGQAMEERSLQFSNEDRNNYQPQVILRLMQIDGMARIEIEHNGVAVDLQRAGQIFEPFFNTHDNGEGTGLGLSLAYYMVTEDHNGEMQLDSSCEEGSRFIVCLPLP